MNLIEQLSQLVGFHTSYANCFGEQVYAKDEARHSLLQAMGYDLSSEAVINQQINALKEQSWRRILSAVHIAKIEEQQLFITISLANCEASHLSWTIKCENNNVITGSALIEELNAIEHITLSNNLNSEEHFSKYQLPLPKLEQGYHQLTVSYINNGIELTENCHLIFAPKICYSPQQASENKVWGIAAQLYSLKSENNWGMGDFGDLQQLVKQSAKHGVSAIGLNPLHPLYQNNPAHRSPYSPTSRCFLNTLYIDVTQVPDFETCQQTQQRFSSVEFQNKVSFARNTTHIDYPAVADVKHEILALLYQYFTEQHLAQQTSLSQEFEQFVQSRGEDLQRLALFDALYEHFRAKDFNAFGWMSWPSAYQNINSDEVTKFAKNNQERIGYFLYLQWLSHRQLSAASEAASEEGMPIGLYLDLAVGCDGAGVDVWSDRSVYVSGAAVGAPPDAMNSLGQDWGLTPINPVALQAQGYQPLVKALRSNMQYAGALRIDHILGLMRQYWVAPGMKADEGVYITFPLEDILRIIALESQREQCVVIGEDLGTVPDGFSEIMANAGLLSYKVLFFERWESGFFMRPEMYPQQSMVTVSTHDLPTLSGWWTGKDLQWRQNLNLYPNAEMGQNERNSRVKDRQLLIAALEDLSVIDSNKLPDQAPAKMNTELSIAVQKYLAQAPSHIQLIPLEDMLEVEEQVNIPGTIDEHPNWLQKLPVSLEQLWHTDSVNALADAMEDARPRS